MARKRQTPEELQELLQMPNFDSPNATAGSAATPAEILAGTATLIPMTEVDPYPENPRKTPNPEYKSIKESIRAVGQRVAVPVARCPATARLMLIAGGGTRYKAIAELFAETGDERFSRIYVIHQAWPDDDSDTQNLLEHLRENELRGSMSFIDSALARVKLRDAWGARSGEAISNKELVRRLRIAGIAADEKAMGLMTHAIEHLLPYLPLALTAGMGRRPISRILGMRRACLHTLKRNDIPIGDFATERFVPILEEHDSAGLHPDDLREDVRLQLLEHVENEVGIGPCGLEWVLEDFEAILNGREKTLPEPCWRQHREAALANTDPSVSVTNTPAIALTHDTSQMADASEGPETAGAVGLSTGSKGVTEAAEDAADQALNATNPSHQATSPPIDSATAPTANRRKSQPDLRQEVRSAADALSTMMGSAWREVGEMMSDASLDDDGAEMIADLFSAFQALRSQVN